MCQIDEILSMWCEGTELTPRKRKRMKRHHNWLCYLSVAMAATILNKQALLSLILYFFFFFFLGGKSLIALVLV